MARRARSGLVALLALLAPSWRPPECRAGRSLATGGHGARDARCAMLDARRGCDVKAPAWPSNGLPCSPSLSLLLQHAPRPPTSAAARRTRTRPRSRPRPRPRTRTRRGTRTPRPARPGRRQALRALLTAFPQLSASPQPDSCRPALRASGLTAPPALRRVVLDGRVVEQRFSARASAGSHAGLPTRMAPFGTVAVDATRAHPRAAITALSCLGAPPFVGDLRREAGRSKQAHAARPWPPRWLSPP